MTAGEDRRPDPRSGLDESGGWSPAFPSQRPPLPPGHPRRVAEGNTLGVRHGAYSERMLAARAQEVFEQLLGFLRSPEDGAKARLLAFTIARIDAAHAWTDEQGLVDGKGDPWGVIADLPRWERQAGRYLSELGLDAAARARIDESSARREAMVSLAEATEAFGLVTRFLAEERRAEAWEALRAFVGLGGGEVGELSAGAGGGPRMRSPVALADMPPVIAAITRLACSEPVPATPHAGAGAPGDAWQLRCPQCGAVAPLAKTGEWRAMWAEEEPLQTVIVCPECVAGLQCVECGATSPPADPGGWRAFLTVDDEVAVHCPTCSDREFSEREEA